MDIEAAQATAERRIRVAVAAAAILGGAPAPTELLLSAQQVVLVLSIGRAYGVKASRRDIVALLAPLVAWQGGFLMWSGMMKILGYSLGAGMVAGAAIAAGLTYAVGKIAQEHFEDLARGGDGLMSEELAAKVLELLHTSLQTRAPALLAKFPAIGVKISEGIDSLRKQPETAAGKSAR